MIDSYSEDTRFEMDIKEALFMDDFINDKVEELLKKVQYHFKLSDKLLVDFCDQFVEDWFVGDEESIKFAYNLDLDEYHFYSYRNDRDEIQRLLIEDEDHSGF